MHPAGPKNAMHKNARRTNFGAEPVSSSSCPGFSAGTVPPKLQRTRGQVLFGLKIFRKAVSWCMKLRVIMERIFVLHFFRVPTSTTDLIWSHLINWSSGTGAKGGSPVGFTGLYIAIVTSSNYYYSSDPLNFTLGSRTDIFGTFTGYGCNLTIPIKQRIDASITSSFLSDFNLSTPSTNQVLAYDSTSSKWINTSTSTAGNWKQQQEQ